MKNKGYLLFFIGMLLNLYMGNAWATSVILQPGTGLGSISFAPNCSLGQLFLTVEFDEYGDGTIQSLNFRQRLAGENWGTTETLPVTFGYTSPEYAGEVALYFVNRGNTANWEAYYIDGNDSTLQRYVRNSNGTWTRTHSALSPSLNGYGNSRPLMASTISPDNTVHFAILDDSGTIQYIKFDGSTSHTETVTTFSNRTYLAAFDSPHSFYPPRHLSIAVDGNNKAHIVYSADQLTTSVTGGTEEKSKLFYVTNSTGNWIEETLIDYGSSSDDAGLGASIAIAPNGTIAVASTYMPRAYTGSPGVAQLRYLIHNSNGTWNSTTVLDSSDGYLSGDGQRGTGLYPYLQFDGVSQPHVIFTDHASEHSGGTAWSYSGQMRYATLSSGSWQIQTLVRQSTSDAWQRRLDNPVVAVSSAACNNQVAFSAVSREAHENPLSFEYINHFFLHGTPPDDLPVIELNEAPPLSWLMLLL